jgi:hypothetical protein
MENRESVWSHILTQTHAVMGQPFINIYQPVGKPW